MHSPHFIVIGNIENKRISLLKESLSGSKIDSVDFVHYNDIVFDIPRLEKYLKTNNVIRLEAPGQNFDLTKNLLMLGSGTVSHKYHFIPKTKINSLRNERGRQLYPYQWFEGYKSFLLQLKNFISSINDREIVFMNDPLDISLMFDKPACQKKLSENGIPIPYITGKFEDYESLIKILEIYKTTKVFIKLPSGSSASGIAAYFNDGRNEYLTTTMEMNRKNTGIAFYDSRKIRTYTDKKDIIDIAGWFSRENAHTELWLEKKMFDGKEFDMRLLIINGFIYHGILRSSDSPFTNLHLGNLRYVINEEIKSFLPWKQIEDICRKIGDMFPDSFYCGVDIMITPDNTPYVLELNAFGDHLNGIYLNNETTHDTELRILLNEWNNNKSQIGQ